MGILTPDEFVSTKPDVIKISWPTPFSHVEQELDADIIKVHINDRTYTLHDLIKAVDEMAKNR